MKYTTILFPIVLVSLLAAGCANEPCDETTNGTCVGHEVGRVLTLQFSRPDVLDVMIEWPTGGVHEGSHEAMFLGAYATPTGGLRVWGGIGHSGEHAASLHAEQTFDVAATRSDLGIYTEPFGMELTANDGQHLLIESAVLFEMQLDDAGAEPMPTGARLLGVISPQVAGSLRVRRLGMTLTELFADSGAEPNIDFDQDGVAESWVAEGSLTTIPATLN